MNLEQRIERTFSPELEQYFLSDVGFIKFHIHEPDVPNRSWGIIESLNGDVRFFTKALRILEFVGASKPYKFVPELEAPLPPGTPVTFTVQQKEDGRFQAHEVLVWEAEKFSQFEEQIASRPLYRLVQSRPMRGGLGSGPVGEEVEKIWKGKNLAFLRKRYPLDKWPLTNGRRFEWLNDEGEWEVVGDPRLMSV